MADAARIPKSYLSRVIHGKADLNADQMYLICKFLNFDNDESEYMQLLLEMEKTGLKERRNKLVEIVSSRQLEKLDTKHHLETSLAAPTSNELGTYYLSPLMQIVHVCLSINRYARNPHQLATDLKISQSKLNNIILTLERLQLIKRSKESIQLLARKIHLPKDSDLYSAWRNQIRLLGMHQMGEVSPENLYSFSVVFSTTKTVRKAIQAKFLEFISEVEKLSANSIEEEAFQLNFDLFPWTYA